jgi:hypothetical protein
MQAMYAPEPSLCNLRPKSADVWLNLSLCPRVASGEVGLRTPREKVSAETFRNRCLEQRSLLLRWLHFKKTQRDKVERQIQLTVAWGWLAVSAPCCTEGDPAHRSRSLIPQGQGHLPRPQCTFLNTCLQTTPCTLIS